MKKLILTLSITTSLFLVSCKKDYLTQEQLQEELAGQTSDLKDWDKIFPSSGSAAYPYTNGTDSLRGIFWKMSSGDIVSQYCKLNNFTWGENYKGFYFDLDTTTYNKTFVLANAYNWEYIYKMFDNDYYHDYVEILLFDLPNNKAIFYSRRLNEIFHTYRRN